MRNAILILCALGLTACGSKTYLLNLSKQNTFKSGSIEVGPCECESIDVDDFAKGVAKSDENKPHYVTHDGKSVVNFADDTPNHEYCRTEIPEDVCKKPTPPKPGTGPSDPPKKDSSTKAETKAETKTEEQTRVASYYLLAGYPQAGVHLAEACKTHFGINNVGTFTNHKGNSLLCGAEQQNCHTARNTWLKSSNKHNWKCSKATQTKPAGGGCVYGLSITTWTCTRTVTVGG